MLLYRMLYIVHAYLMLFAALTNSVCLNNASFFSFFLNIFCQGYELSGEIALKNNQYYYYIIIRGNALALTALSRRYTQELVERHRHSKWRYLKLECCLSL